MIVLPWLPGCLEPQVDDFGIYLLQEEGPPTGLSEGGPDDAAVEDQPLIGLKDIAAYDLENHRMKLSSSTYRRVQELFGLPVKVDGIPFVVQVEDEAIYRGAFWSPASSLI